MGNRKQSSDQFLLDFSFQTNRVLIHLGQVKAQRIGEKLFQDLLNQEWILEPAGEAADLSSANDIIKQLGRKLPYPSTIKVAQIHNQKVDFLGFSALYQQQGWVFINAKLSDYERHYYTFLLTASLGLNQSYPETMLLVPRAEKLVFDVLLPAQEIETFFHKSISKFPTTQALDIADFFRVPFPIILKRALQLDIITDEQYRNFMAVSLKIPIKSRPLFISKSGELEGDFEFDPLYKEF